MTFSVNKLHLRGQATKKAGERCALLAKRLSRRVWAGELATYWKTLQIPVRVLFREKNTFPVLPGNLLPLWSWVLKGVSDLRFYTSFISQSVSVLTTFLKTFFVFVLLFLQRNYCFSSFTSPFSSLSFIQYLLSKFNNQNWIIGIETKICCPFLVQSQIGIVTQENIFPCQTFFVFKSVWLFRHTAVLMKTMFKTILTKNNLRWRYENDSMQWCVCNRLVALQVRISQQIAKYSPT